LEETGEDEGLILKHILKE